MDEHGEAKSVEHQPRHEGGHDLRREGDLEHRHWMRADGAVMPTADPHQEAVGDPLAQERGALAILWAIVIDMRMIALYLRQWPDLGGVECIGHGGSSPSRAMARKFSARRRSRAIAGLAGIGRRSGRRWPRPPGGNAMILADRAVGEPGFARSYLWRVETSSRNSHHANAAGAPGSGMQSVIIWSAASDFSTS